MCDSPADIASSTDYSLFHTSSGHVFCTSRLSLLSAHPPVHHAEASGSRDDGIRLPLSCTPSVRLSVLAALLVLLLAAAAARHVARLLLVDDEAGVALFAVPLEAGEVRVVELVVGLVRSIISQ